MGAAPPPRTNRLAVASLVLGILTPLGCIPGLLSVIFGIVALIRVGDRRERGTGLAIGGLAATGAWAVVIALGIVAAVVTGDPDGAAPRASGSSPEAASGDVTPEDLTNGDCIRELPEGDRFLDVPTVPCDEPHEAQVYSMFDLADGDWAGEDSVIDDASEGCLDLLDADFPGAYDDPDVDIFFLYPTELTWRFGNREVVCAIYYLDGQRTGSLFD